MPRTGIVFIAGLWLTGIITGIVLARSPEAIPLPTPHFTVPLLASLIADLALRPASIAGRIAPISMNQRGLGVIGGAVISLGVAALLAPG